LVGDGDGTVKEESVAQGTARWVGGRMRKRLSQYTRPPAAVPGTRRLGKSKNGDPGHGVAVLLLYLVARPR